MLNAHLNFQLGSQINKVTKENFAAEVSNNLAGMGVRDGDGEIGRAHV